MFRMPTSIDPAEERKKVRAAVNSNIATFAILCAAIRITPILLQRLGFN